MKLIHLHFHCFAAFLVCTYLVWYVLDGEKKKEADEMADVRDDQTEKMLVTETEVESVGNGDDDKKEEALDAGAEYEEETKKGACVEEEKEKKVALNEEEDKKDKGKDKDKDKAENERGPHQ